MTLLYFALGLVVAVATALCWTEEAAAEWTALRGAPAIEYGRFGLLVLGLVSGVFLAWPSVLLITLSVLYRD